MGLTVFMTTEAVLRYKSILSCIKVSLGHHFRVPTWGHPQQSIIMKFRVSEFFVLLSVQGNTSEFLTKVIAQIRLKIVGVFLLSES